jgi:hypothetical protein
MEPKVQALTLNHLNTGAVAGTTNSFTTTAASVCSISGKFAVALAILTNSATTPTLDAVTGVAFPAILPNTAAAIVFGVNAAGTLVAVQGPATPTVTGVTTTVGAFIAGPQFPSIPDNFCPIAYTIARCAPSLTTGVVLGTTQWAAAGASFTTFQNVSTLPDRLQIA